MRISKNLMCAKWYEKNNFFLLSFYFDKEKTNKTFEGSIFYNVLMGNGRNEFFLSLIKEEISFFFLYVENNFRIFVFFFLNFSLLFTNENSSLFE